MQDTMTQPKSPLFTLLVSCISAYCFIRTLSSVTQLFDRSELNSSSNDPQRRRSLLGISTFSDPKSVELRDEIPLEEDQPPVAFFRVAKQMMKQKIWYGASPKEESLLEPSQVLIKVFNPDPNYVYSVTIQSENKYTGSANALGTFGGIHIYEWKPKFPGKYHVAVHEIPWTVNGKYSRLIEPQHLPIKIESSSSVSPMEQVQTRLSATVPCQSVDRIDLYSRWDGDWIGPEWNPGGLDMLRSGWSFLPRVNPENGMNCRLETFSREEMVSSPTPKSIVILGTSRERGIFLSLVDMMLSVEEKPSFEGSVIGQCWGRASVHKGNLRVMYQDFRVKMFEPPNQMNYIECHNEKVVKDLHSSMIANATETFTELFEDPSNWPDVIFLLSKYRQGYFDFTFHLLQHIQILPPSWDGVLIIGDIHFNARFAGMFVEEMVESYRSEIVELVNTIGDPRVRWLDGIGVSKEMRMYGQKGPTGVAISQHFHSMCYQERYEYTQAHPPSEQNHVPDPNAMAVCSNITEMIGQLLVGHALGPKETYLQQHLLSNENAEVSICHACPKDMLPFHIIPHPQLSCSIGPLHDRKVDEIVTFSSGPKICPESCLKQDFSDSFKTESDVVFVRQCPV